MTWPYEPMGALDLETDSPDPTVAVPCSFAVVELVNETVKATTELVNPGREMPEKAIAIHGISNEQAATGMPLKEATEFLALQLLRWSHERMPVVMMNGSYDCTIVDRLCRELLGYSLEEVGWEPIILDVFVLDKAFGNPFRRGKRTLSALCEHHKVEQVDAHSAKGDCISSLRLMRRLAQKYKGIRESSPAELHAQQIEWRRHQMKELSEYLVKQHKDPIPEAEWEWPIQGRELFVDNADAEA